MNKDNKALLESLIESRLKEAMNDDENRSKAFEEAMKAIDRQLEIDSKELDMRKEELKLKYDENKENSKQQFEIDILESKQQFEIKIQNKRQEFELDKEELKSKLETERDKENRYFQLKLEDLKHEHELQRDELNYYREKEKAEKEVKQAKREMFMKGLEIAAVVVVAPLLDFKCKESFAHMLCEFEKDYNFTTMAGKSLSGLFKFKK